AAEVGRSRATVAANTAPRTPRPHAMFRRGRRVLRAARPAPVRQRPSALGGGLLRGLAGGRGLLGRRALGGGALGGRLLGGRLLGGRLGRLLGRRLLGRRLLGRGLGRRLGRRGRRPHTTGQLGREARLR